MGDIIIVLLVFWVVGKLLKGVFGGFSKSSFKDDKSVSYTHLTLPTILRV